MTSTAFTDTADQARGRCFVQFVQTADVIELIQMEYAEMPELQLTFCQARRLWSLSEELCQGALTTLIASGFLIRTPDGVYVRRGSLPAGVEEGAPQPSL
jgi:hypothetical protein